MEQNDVPKTDLGDPDRLVERGMCLVKVLFEVFDVSSFVVPVQLASAERYQLLKLG